MAKTYLAITGELVSGKSTAGKFFAEQYNAEHLRFSKVLDNILGILDLPISRDNEQALGLILKRDFGPEVLTKALIMYAQKSDKDLIVFEGVRKPDELKLLKQLPNFHFLYIKTSVEVRYQRMTARHEKVTDTKQTFEEFKKSQEHATDESLRDLEALADFVIDNNGTLDEYKEQLKKIGEKICS